MYSSLVWLLLPGILITAFFWACAWTSAGIFSENSFFPLWCGYILIVSGLSDVLIGSSLVRRMGFSFAWLFVFSIPMWWFFERINLIVQNWHYELYPISDLHYFIQASIDFSTVIPAVLSTVFLFDHLPHHVQITLRPLKPRKVYLLLSVIVGILSCGLIYEFPREAFPLVWIAPIFLVEPTSYLLGKPCLLKYAQRGDVRIALAAGAAAFFCGVWWELWNFYSFPKWYYTIPYVGCCKVFEMPALGYFGYPFFGVLVVSYSALLCATFLNKNILVMLENERNYPVKRCTSS